VSAVVLTLAYGFYLLAKTRAGHVALGPVSYCPEESPQAITAVIMLVSRDVV
jgi:hypothetical protein